MLKNFQERLEVLEKERLEVLGEIEAEKATEKKALSLKTLEGIIDETRKQIERNSYSKSVPLARFYDQEKVAFLEPIFSMLQNFQERLEFLEKERLEVLAEGGATEEAAELGVQGGRKEGVDGGSKEGEERSGSSSCSVKSRSCVGFTGLSQLDEAKRIETETASVGSERDCRLEQQVTTETLLELQMQTAVAEKKYEEAARLRDAIKALQADKETKAFSLKTLEGIIDEKRKQIERNSYSKSGGGLARFYDQEKIAFLEPICNMLENIQERLEVLEMKD
jgi:hypothetical protein